VHGSDANHDANAGSLSWTAKDPRRHD
jgi:hypothetical protein